MSEQSPAAWHSDPLGRYEKRFWDGQRWTAHVMSGGRQGLDATPAPPPAQTSRTTPAPAAWYADPFGRHERRYWDGRQWTEHVHSLGRQDVDALGDRRAGTSALLTEQVLVVNQKAKLFGSTLEYAIFSQSGQRLGTIQELRRDVATKLRDSVRGRTDANRAHRFRVVDVDDRTVISMTRPEMGWFATKGTLLVEGPQGTPIGQITHESYGVGGSIATAAHAGVDSASAIAQTTLGGVTGLVAGTALGSVQHRLSAAVQGLDKVGHARFGLEADGRRLGSVDAEDTKQWDFQVHDTQGSEVARITKAWAGWTKERFTKADNYVVEMHRPLDEPFRSLVIASALAIDVELKQRGDQTRGSSLWGTRRYK